MNVLKYLVRDWTCAGLEEFDTFEEADKYFEENKKERLKNGEECDIQLLALLKDFNNVG